MSCSDRHNQLWLWRLLQLLERCSGDAADSVHVAAQEKVCQHVGVVLPIWNLRARGAVGPVGNAIAGDENDDL